MADQERPDVTDRDLASFGPEEFAEMSPDEWEGAFDPDTWVTGRELLDRLETDLRRRIAERDVFAVIERIERDDQPCLLAYSDESYALVYPDGTVEGFGTVMRDVKPSVAMCSIPEYDPEPPIDPALGQLPDPAAVDAARSDLGNRMLQLIGFALGVGAIVLLGAWLLADATIVAAIIGLGFLLVSVIVLFIVANARLSARYRAEEYRDRLRAAGVGSGDRPSFVPDDES